MDVGQYAMIQAVSFIVNGLPIAQPRHRVSCRNGAFPRMYIPKAHAVHSYKAAIIEKAIANISGMIEGAVKLDCLFVFKATRKNQIAQYRISKPDLDNLVKAVMDGITQAGERGHGWGDDAQVVELHCAKMFGVSNYAQIRIEPIGFSVGKNCNAVETP